MNVLPKGTLTVMVATLIASILILWTGKSVAESDNSAEVLNKKPVSPPPPGPFFLGNPIDNDLSGLEDSKIVPVAPKISATKESKNKEIPAVTPKKPVSPEMNVKQPDLKIEPPAQVKITKRAETPVSGPVFKRAKPSIPMTPEKAPVMRQKSPQKPKQIVMPKTQPVWMQKPPVNKQVQPSPPVGQDLSKRLPPIQNATPPKQRYMYIPMPMYPPNYAYPQMPAQGANYYQPRPNFNMPQARGQMGNPQRMPNTPKLNEGLIK